MKPDRLLARLCLIYGPISDDHLALYANVTKYHAHTPDWAVDRILAHTKYRGVERLHGENHDPKNPAHYKRTWPTVKEIGEALGMPRDATAEERRFVDLCAAGKINMGSRHKALREIAITMQQRRTEGER